MRAFLVVVHRVLGLAAAAFLFVAGLTGAVISWDHELDAWLNPQFYRSPSAGEARASLALANEVERSDPRLRVTYLPLALEPGAALLLGVEGRFDPAKGTVHEPGFNQVALDPVSGAVQARREWGEASLSRENLLPFLYKLHYSLHLPIRGVIDYGVLFMGVVAIVWVADTFVALWLSFPKWSAWRQSFAFRWRTGGYRLVFDVHRSGGVWVFLLLVVLSVTAVSMNLGPQVVRPIVGWFSPLTPTPFDALPTTTPETPIEPRIDRERAVSLAREEAARREWPGPPGAVFYSPEYGVYGVGFFAPGHDHGDGGLGNPWLYLAAEDGRLISAEVPGRGSAGDVFMQAQFPLHSGRILGVAGRALISLMGLAVAVLSATGVLIWAKKRRVRRQALRVRVGAQRSELGHVAAGGAPAGPAGEGWQMR